MLFPASTDAQFHIAIRCTVTEACRWAGFGVRERENHSTGAVRTRPFRSSKKAVWAKASHCGLNREKTGNGRENRDSVSKVQVRRTAVSAAYCGEKDECVGRALPVAFGTCAPFFLTRKAAFFCFYGDPPAILKNGGFSFLQKPSALPVSAPTLDIRGSR